MERVDPKRPRVENPGVLAIVMPGLAFEEILMGSEPHKYVEGPHDNGYPTVLVRLNAIDADELEDLLTQAWKTKAEKAALSRVRVSGERRRVRGF